jgi:general secretion pathway protein C
MVKIPELQLTDIAHLMQGVWVQRAIRVINALLVIWIAWLLATLTWSLLEEPETEPAVAEAPAPVKTAPDRNMQLVRQLPAWHLFGEAVQQAAPVKQSIPVDAPETRLKLVLHGAFASDDPEIARAIIADPRGEEEMYAVGDKLPGDAELREIHPEKIILLRGGRYETLRLPDERRGAGATGLRPDASISTFSAVANTPAQRLRSIRQQLRQNPRTLYGLVRATPKKDEAGKMVGYTLRPGRDPELFKQMNLQDGDVVTRINNIALDSLANGMQALKSAQAGQTVTMTVLRDGREQALSFGMPE